MSFNNMNIGLNILIVADIVLIAMARNETTAAAWAFYIAFGAANLLLILTYLPNLYPAGGPGGTLLLGGIGASILLNVLKPTSLDPVLKAVLPWGALVALPMLEGAVMLGIAVVGTLMNRNAVKKIQACTEVAALVPFLGDYSEKVAGAAAERLRALDAPVEELRKTMETVVQGGRSDQDDTAGAVLTEVLAERGQAARDALADIHRKIDRSWRALSEALDAALAKIVVRDDAGLLLDLARSGAERALPVENMLRKLAAWEPVASKEVFREALRKRLVDPEILLALPEEQAAGLVEEVVGNPGFADEWSFYHRGYVQTAARFSPARAFPLLALACRSPERVILQAVVREVTAHLLPRATEAREEARAFARAFAERIEDLGPPLSYWRLQGDHILQNLPD